MIKDDMKRVLVVEDHLGDARLLQLMFNEKTASVVEFTHVETMGDAEAHLSANNVDFILLDLGLPDTEGMEAIRRARRAAPRVPLLILTGLDDEDVAEQALHEGAQDYLIKGQIDSRGLRRAMRCAAERKRLEELKDEFVSTVSHELRTPLTSIFASLGLLVGNAARTLDPQANRLLTIAHTNTQRLVRLVNDILDIEKLGAGQVKFNLTEIDVRSVVRNVIEANLEYAEAREIRVRFEAEKTVKNVRADADRLFQVVTNLLSNAIKFSLPSNEVVVSVANNGDFVSISVQNGGPGIAEKFKPHVFERFAQADATNSRQSGGTGLGLSIVKQIVDRLGGAVGFNEAPGGGTIFVVDLPCWERRAVVESGLRAPPVPMRVLLCTDNEALSLSLGDQLGHYGCGADRAGNVADALTLAAKTQYDAVLVDLSIAGDDVHLILRLHEVPQYSRTPIIIVSASPSHGQQDAISPNPSNLGWLTKPLDIGHLMQVLKEVGLRDTGATLVPDIEAKESINSIEEARRVLHAGEFDVALRLGPSGEPDAPLSTDLRKEA